MRGYFINKLNRLTEGTCRYCTDVKIVSEVCEHSQWLLTNNQVAVIKYLVWTVGWTEGRVDGQS